MSRQSQALSLQLEACHGFEQNLDTEGALLWWRWYRALLGPEWVEEIGFAPPPSAVVGADTGPCHAALSFLGSNMGQVSLKLVAIARFSLSSMNMGHHARIKMASKKG